MSKGAMGAIIPDLARELCQQGCREWIPWYQDKKGETVYGCRIGMKPEMRDGQWYCRRLLKGK